MSVPVSTTTRPWLRAAIRFCVEQPRFALLGWFIAICVATAGLTVLDFDTTTESVLDRNDPAWSFYQESLRRFGGDQVLVVAVEGERPFDSDVLREVERISRLAADVEGVRRVDSVATFPFVHVTAEGELTLDPAMELLPADPAVAKELRSRIERDRIARRNLVSDDGRVFAINVWLRADADDLQQQAVAALKEIMGQGPAWLSGVPVFRLEVNVQTRSEIFIFVPITVIVIALLLGAIFATPMAAVISLVTSSVGVAVALGVMGAVGTPVTISTMILPSILLALGSAYVMHVLSAAQGLEESEDLIRAVESIANPVVLSGFTTAIGFVALSSIQIDVVRDLGSFGALGVVCVTFAALTLAPALLRIWPLRAGAPWLDRLVRTRIRVSLIDLARRRGGLVLAVWVLLIGIFSIGLVRLEVETDAVRWFPVGTDVRDSYEAIRERLSGISPMNVIIESEDGSSVTEPRVLRAIADLGRYLEDMEEVGRVISVVDPLLQLHQGFSPDAVVSLPDDQALIEQYLLLLSSMEFLDDVVTWDRKSANLLLRADSNGSEDLVRIASRAESWWEEHGPVGFRARATGIMFEFARSQNELAWGQIRGLGFALAAIGILFYAIFRWPGVALIAMVPNVVPLAIVFGFMGLVGIPLDAVTVGLGSMALGIAVDDTIHIVNGYRNGIVAGHTGIDSIDETFKSVLPPLIYSTIAIGAGFGVLALSNFTVTQNLGIVTAGTVVLCLLADLTLLPSLLLRFGR